MPKHVFYQNELTRFEVAFQQCAQQQHHEIDLPLEVLEEEAIIPNAEKYPVEDREENNVDTMVVAREE